MRKTTHQTNLSNIKQQNRTQQDSACVSQVNPCPITLAVVFLAEKWAMWARWAPPVMFVA